MLVCLLNSAYGSNSFCLPSCIKGGSDSLQTCGIIFKKVSCWLFFIKETNKSERIKVLLFIVDSFHLLAICILYHMFRRLFDLKLCFCPGRSVAIHGFHRNQEFLRKQNKSLLKKIEFDLFKSLFYTLNVSTYSDVWTKTTQQFPLGIVPLKVNKPSLFFIKKVVLGMIEWTYSMRPAMSISITESLDSALDFLIDLFAWFDL